MGIVQFGRKASLFVVKPVSEPAPGQPAKAVAPEKVLDLSNMHFQFQTQNQDEEGPSNVVVRVFNLNKNTVESLIRFDFSRVVVQAGYEGQFGVIFDGSIRQFRTGRLSATDTYVDILAADGDLAYAYGIVAKSIGAGSTGQERRSALMEGFSAYGVTLGKDLGATGGVLPRGKVMFGMARSLMRAECNSISATWSIQNGKVNIIPLDSYLPGQAVRLTAATGLIGVPEQTQDGVKVRCLLNPRIVVGGLVQLDNKSINQTHQADPSLPIPANQWATPQFNANVTTDGIYRVYVCEHTGDTRGVSYYSDLVCLAVDPTSNKVEAS